MKVLCGVPCYVGSTLLGPPLIDLFHYETPSKGGENCLRGCFEVVTSYLGTARIATELSYSQSRQGRFSRDFRGGEREATCTGIQRGAIEQRSITSGLENDNTAPSPGQVKNVRLKVYSFSTRMHTLHSCPSD
jgi:hypothetical protein